VVVLLDDTSRDAATADSPFRNSIVGLFASNQLDRRCTIYVPGFAADASGLPAFFGQAWGSGSRNARDSAYLQLLERATPASRIVILGAGTGALNAVMLTHTLGRIGLSRVAASVDRRNGWLARLVP